MYWGLINFSPEAILYIMALTKNEEIQKAVSNFYTRHRYVKPIIKGQDILAIGIRPGPVYTKILHLILNEKLDGKLQTRKDELAFATRYAIENDLIA